MDGSAVNAIAGLANSAAGKVVSIDGVMYSTVELHDPRKEASECDVLAMSKLSALAQFVGVLVEVQKLAPEDILVTVDNSACVTVRSSKIVGAFRQREAFGVAMPRGIDAHKFGIFMALDEFNIYLQSRFADGGRKSDVLKLVGNITDENVKNATDDGVAQQVVARAGISGKVPLEVPNPVMLAPYRTFSEVKQPESPFILRLQRVEGQLPRAALFEADGGRWQVEAVEVIRAFVEANLPKGVGIVS